VYAGDDPVAVRVEWIQLNGLLRELKSTPFGGIVAPVIERACEINVAENRMGAGKARIGGDRLLEQGFRLRVCRARHEPGEFAALEK